jgi:AcrR family transcriptional regulator
MRDADGTRTKIVEAALRLFVERGVAETGIREIAAAAGISEGAMYRHFAGKEALVWSLFETGFTAFARRLADAGATAPDLEAATRMMVGEFCALFDRDPLRFRFILLVQHGQLAKVTPEIANPSDVVRDVIIAGMQRREIPKADPELLTAMVMGIILQTATARIYGRVGQRLGDLAPALSAACWRVLSGRAA